MSNGLKGHNCKAQCEALGKNIVYTSAESAAYKDVYKP